MFHDQQLRLYQGGVAWVFQGQLKALALTRGALDTSTMISMMMHALLQKSHSTELNQVNWSFSGADTSAHTFQKLLFRSWRTCSEAGHALVTSERTCTSHSTFAGTYFQSQTDAMGPPMPQRAQRARRAARHPAG